MGEEEGKKYFKIVFDDQENRYKVEPVRIFKDLKDAFKCVKECNEDVKERELEDCREKMEKHQSRVENKKEEEKSRESIELDIKCEEEAKKTQNIVRRFGFWPFYPYKRWWRSEWAK